MNTIDISLIVLLLFFTAIYVVSSMQMVRYSVKRGDKMSFFLLRLQLLKAARNYRIASRKESGRTGLLFYAWIISINLAFISFIAILVLNLIPLIG